jgi:hypothetical protein
LEGWRRSCTFMHFVLKSCQRIESSSLYDPQVNERHASWQDRDSPCMQTNVWGNKSCFLSSGYIALTVLSVQDWSCMNEPLFPVLGGNEDSSLTCLFNDVLTRVRSKADPVTLVICVGSICTPWRTGGWLPFFSYADHFVCFSSNSIYFSWFCWSKE